MPESITASSAPAPVQRQQMAMQEHRDPSSTATFATSGTSTSLMEVSAFMTEQLRAQMTEQRVHDKAQHKETEEKLDTQRREYEAKLRDCETKLEAQRREYEAKLRNCEAQLEAQRHEYEAKLEAQRQDAKAYISDAQLERLQARLDALHQAKLLTDDEMLVLEDKVADFIGCRLSMMVAPGEIGAAAESVRKLAGMCEGVTKDGMLVRLLRRQVL